MERVYMNVSLNTRIQTAVSNVNHVQGAYKMVQEKNVQGHDSKLS